MQRYSKYFLKHFLYLSFSFLLARTFQEMFKLLNQGILLTFFPGKGKAPDLKYVERAARDIADMVTPGQHKIVVEKSTVPVKAAESIGRILRANMRDGATYQVRK